MPPVPKDPATRRRRNKNATNALLRPLDPSEVDVPWLPDIRVWHAQTEKWWSAVWASPMSVEIDRADMSELVKLAILEDDFWWCEDPSFRLKLAAEIRLQRQSFGLTPLDRKRLQWTIEKTDTELERGAARRSPRAVADPRTLDPRLMEVSGDQGPELSGNVG